VATPALAGFDVFSTPLLRASRLFITSWFTLGSNFVQPVLAADKAGFIARCGRLPHKSIAPWQALNLKKRYRPLEKPFNVPYQLSIISLQPVIGAKTLLTKTDPDQIPTP
jgi:hypothetical protein